MRHIRLFAALAAACLLLPAAAQGQTNDPLDPDSPAGVEYQLPLERARKNAGGGGDDATRESRATRRGAAPLFGAGIVAVKHEDPKDDAGHADGGGSETAASPPEADRADATSGSPTAADRPRVSRAAVGGVDSDAGSATWRIAGVAIAVLLAGAALGLGLRRGLGQPGE